MGQQVRREEGKNCQLPKKKSGDTEDRGQQKKKNQVYRLKCILKSIKIYA
jgi:hypothetical protein